MLIKRINLATLLKDYPFDIKDIFYRLREFDIKCRESINLFKTLENVSDSKNILIEIINLALEKLRILELSKSDERENFYKLQRDVSNCINFLETREKELVTGGERELEKAKLIVLIGDYRGIYRTLLNIFKDVKDAYINEIKNDKNISEKKKASLFVLYHLLQVNFSLYETRVISGSGSAKTIKVRESWPGMMAQAMRNEMRENRESKIEKVQEYAAQIKILAEELKLKVNKEGKEDKAESTKEKDIEANEPEEIKPKVNGGKMEEDEDLEDDEDTEEPEDDKDWE